MVLNESDGESDGEEMAQQQSDAAVRLKLLKAEVPEEQLPKNVGVRTPSASFYIFLLFSVVT